MVSIFSSFHTMPANITGEPVAVRYFSSNMCPKIMILVVKSGPTFDLIDLPRGWIVKIQNPFFRFCIEKRPYFWVEASLEGEHRLHEYQ